MRRLIPVVLAYLASKAVFELFDFQRYDPVSEPLRVGKLAIDLGVFLVFYYGFSWLLGRLRSVDSPDGR